MTGAVVQADGSTPGAAAVIDVTAVDRLTHAPLSEPYARAVATVDGSFVLDLTPTAPLADVLGPLGDGAPISLQLTVADLVRTTPDSVHVESFVDFVHAAVRRIADGTVSVHISEMDRVKHFVTSAEQTVIRTLSPLAIFGDPDLVAGNEDVNDPALIPPLGSELAVVPITEATSTVETVPHMPAPDGCGGTIAASTTGDRAINGGIGGAVATPMCQEDAGGGTGSPCTLARTYWFPEDGNDQPMNGVKMSATIKLYQCTNESDDDYAYWGVSTDGWVRGLDEASGTYGGVKVWRYKFRIEAPSWAEAYRFMQVDPKENDKNGGTVSWSVGLSAGGPSGSISGDFTPGNPGWMHPWPEDTDRQLYHVSFIADNKWGAGGGPYWNGGGVTYRVPKDTDVDGFASIIKREILVWRCWMEHTEREYQWFCDPRS